MSAKRQLRLGTTIHGTEATKYGRLQPGQSAEAAKFDFVLTVDRVIGNIH